MKKLYCTLILVFLCSFLTSAKEKEYSIFSFTLGSNVFLSSCYPSSRSLVNAGTRVTVISFNKKTNQAFVYSDSECGYVGVTAQLAKQILDAKVKDMESDNKNIFDAKVNSIEKRILSRHDSIYTKSEAIRYAQFVKDSLEYEQRFADTLEISKHNFDSLSTSLKTSISGVHSGITKILDQINSLAPVIVNVKGWYINSVGGITADIEVVNLTSKIIKYISFNGYFTNAVNDRVYNEIGRNSTFSIQGVGPINPKITSYQELVEDPDKNFASFSFDDPFFYSNVADRIHITSVNITFMNGTKSTISGNSINSRVLYNESNLQERLYKLSAIKQTEEVEGNKDLFIYHRPEHKDMIYKKLPYEIYEKQIMATGQILYDNGTPASFVFIRQPKDKVVPGSKDQVLSDANGFYKIYSWGVGTQMEVDNMAKKFYFNATSNPQNVYITK